LGEWAANSGVQLPFVPAYCDQTYHMFYLVMPDHESRTALIEHLNRHRILSVFHYMPLHLSAMGKRFGGFPGQCPVAERISDRLLRLPIYSGLSESDQSRILEAIRAFSVARPKALAAGAAESPRVPRQPNFV
jgi:dTDP-4-amino-4,6-dideoxygalactose transaminase